jgi:molecular chaperone GrpE
MVKMAGWFERLKKGMSMSDAPKSEQEVPPKEPVPETNFEKETEELCALVEKSFKKAYEASGNMPDAMQMSEVRGHVAMIKDLVERAREAAKPSEEIEQQLKTALAERDKLKDQVTRAKADFLNYQDRASKDLAKAEEGALRGYVSDMLPVLDNLQLSLADALSEQADLKRAQTALEMIADGLQQTLKVRGLEQIDANGKPFDPIYHESIASRPVDAAKEEKPNQVAEVCRAGYTWKGKVLRPAQVLITK